VIGGITTVVTAGLILCAAGGCESGAFQAAGLACARSGVCLRAVSGAMTAGGAINSGYGAGELPSGAMGKSGSWLGRLFCRSSFTPGTKVLMADGSKKNIEDLRVGDRVLATDPETGETKAEPILGTITSKGAKKLVQISVDDKAPALAWMTGRELRSISAKLPGPKPFKGKSGALVATDKHPFWVAGSINTWMNATDLRPGMWLRTSFDTYVQVAATKHRTTHYQRVHNLTIANAHTYYVLVGETPVLVHNADSDLPPIIKEAIENQTFTPRTKPDGTPDIFEARNGTPGKIARKWGGSQIYDVPGGGNSYRIMINGYGDIGWVSGHNYKKINLYKPPAC
ncbi:MULTISPECIES: polymorphic toxin-type HINT domain-containing protein, partial [unclassified Spirillospora]|uniref:polymorphic toxin-type HINT domain-containing protein n=1 Tax=unclassified Spirillospora TaxID=2642701 RepID=UPI0037235D34